ncbi:hypothetical protein TNCV_3342921 [Trichonephila clavipes]|nr:hypothetical protein TNCV_3342921 [Trichonephila clavipes]
MPNQLVHEERVGQISDVDGLQKCFLVLRTRNWRTLAGRRQTWKRILKKPGQQPPWIVEPLRKEEIRRFLKTPSYADLCSAKWLPKLTAEPLGMGLNPGEDLDVCKCIVLSSDGGTLSSRLVASLLVKLMEGEIEVRSP